MIRFIAAAGVLAYFLLMAWPGLQSTFSHDDLMNMTNAVRDGIPRIVRGLVLFFSTQYRPLGGLFYASFYHLFGWNPLPFRIVCYVVLGLNLWLLAKLASELDGRWWTGALAAFLIAYHGNFTPLFMGSGNCYDVFVFAFYVGGLLFYVRARRHGPLAWRQIAILSALFVLGLDSKEMAVSMPGVLAIYEVFFIPRRDWDLRSVTVIGSIALIYAGGKMLGAGSLVHHPAYKPTFTAPAYLESTAHWMNELVYRTNWITPGIAAIVLVALVGVAALLRNRPMLFGGLFVVVAPLPVAFLFPRGLGAHYITLAGLAIWMAAGLSAAVSASARIPLRGIRISSHVVAACLLILLSRSMLQAHWQARTFYTTVYASEMQTIQEFAAALQRHPDWWSNKQASILYLNDPFYPDFRWASTFITMLVSGDMYARVELLPALEQKPDPAAFTVVAEYQDGTLVRVPNTIPNR